MKPLTFMFDARITFSDVQVCGVGGLDCHIATLAFINTCHEKNKEF